jgi:hypothetical protein
MTFTETCFTDKLYTLLKFSPCTNALLCNHRTSLKLVTALTTVWQSMLFVYDCGNNFFTCRHICTNHQLNVFRVKRNTIRKEQHSRNIKWFKPVTVTQRKTSLPSITDNNHIQTIINHGYHISAYSALLAAPNYHGLLSTQKIGERARQTNWVRERRYLCSIRREHSSCHGLQINMCNFKIQHIVRTYFLTCFISNSKCSPWIYEMCM